LNRARALAHIAAGLPDPEADAWLRDRLRAWLLRAGAGGQGPEPAHRYIGLRSAADGRRQARDHWLREAAQHLPEAGSWTRARQLFDQLDLARRFRRRQRLQQEARSPSPIIAALALALDCGAPMPGSLQALHNILTGSVDADEADAA
jgi:hypothetical protein